MLHSTTKKNRSLSAEYYICKMQDVFSKTHSKRHYLLLIPSSQMRLSNSPKQFTDDLQTYRKPSLIYKHKQILSIPKNCKKILFHKSLAVCQTHSMVHKKYKRATT